MLPIPKNRKIKSISYVEFQKLRSEGATRSTLISEGISKHQISFFYSLSKNKISISKEQFESEYLSGKSLVEIAEEFGISKDFIVHLREHFGIKRLGPKFIHRKKNEQPLTFRQQKIIYGSLMGDAGKISSSSIRMKQSVKQKFYLEWKFHELQNLVSKRGVKKTSSYQKAMGKTYYAYEFYTSANTEIEDIILKFYSPHKHISQNILDNLDELSLAVWFMDDGYTGWGKCENSKPSAHLCTDSFLKSECNLICNWFQQKYGIDPHLRTRNKEKQSYRVVFPTVETPKLFALIRPYIIPSMMYKIERTKI